MSLALARRARFSSRSPSRLAATNCLRMRETCRRRADAVRSLIRTRSPGSDSVKLIRAACRATISLSRASRTACGVSIRASLKLRLFLVPRNEIPSTDEKDQGEGDVEVIQWGKHDYRRTELIESSWRGSNSLSLSYQDSASPIMLQEQTTHYICTDERKPAGSLRSRLVPITASPPATGFVAGAAAWPGGATPAPPSWPRRR